MDRTYLALTSEITPMRLYCRDCHTKLKHVMVEEIEEPRGECFGFNSYETIINLYCPECGSEDLEEYDYDDEEDDDDE